MSGSFRAMRRSAGAMAPVLLLGLAAGATGGVWAASALDTTPYDTIDFNTASRDARQAGKSEGWEAAQKLSAQARARLRETNDKRVDALEKTVDDLRITVRKRDKALAKAEKAAEQQDAKLAKTQSSLAETTAALGNATGELGDGHIVDGVLKVSQVLTRKPSQKLPGCADSLQDYQVRVLAGADATVATARLVRAEATATSQPAPKEKPGRSRGAERKPRVETVNLTCSLSYTVSLPTPLGAAYRFIAVQPSKPDAPLASKATARAALEDGNGPTLSVSR
jgi:hypothetical protein